MSSPVPIVVVSVDELRAIVRDAVREALDARSNDEPAEWLDAEGVAELLCVHPRTVQKLVRQQQLPAHRIGRLYRFRRADVIAWFDTRRSR